MSAVALGVGRGSPMVSNSADWLLRDEFTSDLAAGSVNGTAAEPGPGTRVVLDTGNRLSLSEGNALFAAGATPEFSLKYGAISRAPGRMVIGSVSKSNIGLIVGTASTTTVFAVRYDDGFSLQANWGGPQIQGPVTDSTIARAIVVRSSGYFVLLRLNGSWLFRWIDDITIPNADPFYPGIAALFAGYPSATADFIRVPAALWLPTPLASDGFGSAFGTTDGLGHAEGIAGGIGAGGSGLTWSNAGSTWSVSGGKATNTPSLGAEREADPGMEGGYTGGVAPYWSTQLGPVAAENTTDMRSGSKCQQLQGNVVNQAISQNQGQLSLTTGTWYRFSFWAKRIAGTAGNCGAVMMGTYGFTPGASLHYSLSGYTISNPTYSERYRVMRCTNQGYFKYDAILFGNAATGDTIVMDDISVKPLALSELISVLSAGTSDVFCTVSITQASTASGAACPSGLVLNCDSASDPQNFVVVYINREVNISNEYVRIEKRINGTWASVGGAKYTYSAGARLVVVKNGSEYRVYYNNALVGAYTIADASIVSNTLHGIFSTDASNTLDNFVCYATGTGGEYAELNKWS